MRGLDVLRGLAPLGEALRAALPADQAERCRVAGFRGGRLWVEVDSAPLCAELRNFQREALRLALNRQLAARAVRQQVAEIVFRIGGTGHA
jgi:hypothetical protein